MANLTVPVGATDTYSMTEYWFVVAPEHRDLYEGLKAVLDGRPGFHIITERRSRANGSPGDERRTAHVWDGGLLRIEEHRHDD